MKGTVITQGGKEIGRTKKEMTVGDFLSNLESFFEAGEQPKQFTEAPAAHPSKEKIEKCIELSKFPLQPVVVLEGNGVTYPKDVQAISGKLVGIDFEEGLGYVRFVDGDCQYYPVENLKPISNEQFTEAEIVE